MKIAMVGIRGVPARYGGLETCGEEVGSRLAARGHKVWCYCRTGTPFDGLEEHRGVKRIELPNLKAQVTDTYSHSFLAMCHILKLKPDVVFAFNPAISSLCLIPRLFGYPVALNPDGYDWRRDKWGRFGQAFIHASAGLAARVCDQLVVDAVSVRDYYAQRFRCRSEPVYLPNGAEVEASYGPEVQRSVLAQYGLEKDGYFLFLSRFVPENSCELIIQAFKQVKTDKKLFFGGGQATDNKYARQVVESTRDERILFPGALYDPVHVKELHCGCYAVLNGNQPGGTSLGLLKALGYGACVVTLDTTDNAYAVQGGAGRTFALSIDSLCETLQDLIDHPTQVEAYRTRAVERVREEYRWDVIADGYEAVFRGLVERGGRK